MNPSIELKKTESTSVGQLEAAVSEACVVMDRIYQSGFYPKVEVERSWSKHNPVIQGEFAKPEAYRWYLKREMMKLLEMGAQIRILPSRPIVPLDDPHLLDHVDEDQWDFTQKKLFLFQPERIDLSLDRLAHYTGTNPKDFQRFILFTNYAMHVEVFLKRFPQCIRPSHDVQMPAYHHKLDDHLGITLINIGVGPSNAKTITDHIAVLRPDAMIMVGHCGGLRNHQEIGDFILANGYMRADRVLDEMLPPHVPIVPNHLLNIYLEQALKEFGMQYRIGTVYTTVNRNWEFAQNRTAAEIHVSRSSAVDMESATVATNGFRYRIPHATLLCVSDKPLHGKPKLSREAQSFYQNSKEQHLDIVVRAIEILKRYYPAGLPNSSIRAADEPLLGGAD